MLFSVVCFQWDLVCDYKWKKPLTSSVFFCGVLSGAFICGQLADRFFTFTKNVISINKY